MDDIDLELVILGLRYAQDLVKGRTWVNQYMEDSQRWWTKWSRVYHLVAQGHDTKEPLEWPAIEENLQAGSWDDTPCDCFRGIPHPPLSGNSIHDID